MLLRFMRNYRTSEQVVNQSSESLINPSFLCSLRTKMHHTGRLLSVVVASKDERFINLSLNYLYSIFTVCVWIHEILLISDVKISSFLEN